MAELGELTVNIGANTTALDRGLRNVDRRMNAVRRRMGQTTNTMKRWTMAVSAAGAVMGGAILRNSIRSTDQLGKMADQLGVNVESLQELRYAAERAGVEQRTLDMALQRFTRRAAEAANGTGEAKDALQQMGIQLRDSSGNIRDTEEMLDDVADAFQKIQNPAERTRLAFKLFDSEGVAMVNMLRNGSDGLSEMTQRARDLGIVLDESLVRRAEKANDQMTDMSRIMRTAAVNVSMEFLPVMRDLANLMMSPGFQEGVRTLASNIRDMVQWMVQNKDTIMSVTGALAGLKVGRLAGLPGMLAGGVIGWNLPEIVKQAFDDGVEEIRRQKTRLEEELEGIVNMPVEKLFGGGTDFEKVLEPLGKEAREKVFAITEQLQSLDDKLKAIGSSASISFKTIDEELGTLADSVNKRVAQLNAPSFNFSDTGGGGGGVDYEARVEKLREFVSTEAEIEQKRHDQRLEDLRAALENEVIVEQEYKQLKIELEQAHIERMNEIRQGDNERRIEKLREHLMTEEEILIENHEKHMEWLEQALEDDYIKEEEYKRMKEDLERKHQDNLRKERQRGMSDLEKLQNASMGKQLSEFAAAGNSMIAAAGQINEGMAKAAKIGGAAQAFIATLVGQAEALKLGWPAGPIAAAKIAAQGFGLVAAIQGAGTKGAGSTVGTGSNGFNNSGGGGGTTANQGDSTPNTQRIMIDGLSDDAIMSGGQVRKLIDQINEAQQDGTRLLVV